MGLCQYSAVLVDPRAVHDPTDNSASHGFRLFYQQRHQLWRALKRYESVAVDMFPFLLDLPTKRRVYALSLTDVKKLLRFAENSHRARLIDIYSDCLITQNKLITMNAGLAAHAAKRLANGNNYTDLYQSGILGLYPAVQRFDDTLHYRFSTYAMYWIRSFMHRALRKDLKHELMERCTDDDLENIPDDCFEEDLSYQLERRDKVNLIRMIVEGRVEHARILLDYAVEKKGDKKDVDHSVLNARRDLKRVSQQLQLIDLRFGRNYSYEQIAKIFGVSKQRVQQIEYKLKRELSNYV